MRLKVLRENFFPGINTLRFRISILYVAIIGLILILFQGVLYFIYVNSFSREFDLQLQMKAEQIGGAVNTFRGMMADQRQAFTLAAQQAINLGIEYPNYEFMTESPEKFWLADAKKLGLDKDFLVIMDEHGDVVTKSQNVTKELLSYFRKIGRTALNKPEFFKANINNGILRIVVEPYYYTFNQGYYIAVGTPYGPIEGILWRNFLFIVSSTVVFLVFASLIVRLFVIRVLSSVMEISKVARNISQENLNARIKLTDTDEEMEHLTGSLNEMIARLEKSFEHIKEFSLEMAHEVKTPLAIISVESQHALRQDHTKEEYKDILKSVYKQAKRTQRFVSDLLLITKLDYRLIKLRFEPIDLADFLREVCDEMGVITSPEEIIIRQDIPHGPVFLKGNKIHLRRVFFNLIDNALKFTPPGGRIDVVLRVQDQKAVVLISDTGCGIDVHEITKIFKKFYRANKNDPDSGSGLGLSIAESIITLHGGGIAVQSESEKGTSFRMEFPLIEQAAFRN